MQQSCQGVPPSGYTNQNFVVLCMPVSNNDLRCRLDNILNKMNLSLYLIYLIFQRDPLMLEQLWRRMSGNARDVQPGYSPKRYLNHLSQNLGEESWKKLVESGLLKSFSSTDDSFLPPLLPDKYGSDLQHRPPPYTTMSLPPVSPSSSMLGSFTFYKHALSTGAASMVSLPSVNSEIVDDQLSAKTAGTFVESLAERLAEVTHV